ncbi:hypothetical protein [Cellulomonas sp. KRMCY2]|uniref:hypothetical protein n=1 Tax=Cellulomonas sp. KRMCY2 TaxID=1304865 RepID=UPI0012DF305C|nr:hypothetical protein [Cellulomonas sp. KRMCY2]
MGRHSAPEPTPRPVSEQVPGDARDHPATPADHRSAIDHRSVTAPTPVHLDPPAAAPAPAAAAGPTGGPPAAPTPPSGWRERAVLAGAATITTGAVMAWAGAQLWATGAGALGAGAVVLIASWVAATVPGLHHPAGPAGAEGSAAGRSDGHRPG